MTINCKGRLIDLSTPKVMGILNATPDSFFDGGNYHSDRDYLHAAERILAQRTDFIDVGGYSSRPGADFVSAETERRRVVPVIESIIKHFPEALISVDTFRSEVARACIESGASIINDISAGNLDNKMFETVASLQVPYIMMHMRGTPETMQSQTNYTDLIKEILFYFSEKIAQLRSLGINDIVVDPGFGFSKTIEQNFELLQKLELINIAGLPILVGISRKSMIYKSLKIDASAALNGTTALNMLALSKGAKILRVHDVAEAVECVELYNLTHGAIGGDKARFEEL